MSAAKKPAHTPGPWAISRMLSGSENDKGFNITGPATARRRYAWIAEVSPMNDERGDAGKEGKANARLIAAAPKLYEALWAICEGMEASGGWEGDDELFNLGMAAIREAEAGHGD